MLYKEKCTKMYIQAVQTLDNFSCWPLRGWAGCQISVLSSQHYPKCSEKPSASQTCVSSVIFIYISRGLAASWTTQPITNNIVTVSPRNKIMRISLRDWETPCTYKLNITHTQVRSRYFCQSFISKQIDNSLFFNTHLEIHCKQVSSGILLQSIWNIVKS